MVAVTMPAQTITPQGKFCRKIIHSGLKNDNEL